MGGNQAFFKAPQPAAVLKHGILKRYVVVFASKTGSRSGGKVIFLDGYAGPGRYESGDPASPLLALRTARSISAFRDLRCIFVELDVGYFAQLNAVLAEEAGDLDVVAHQGRIEDHLVPLIEGCGNVPLFAYLDPFGVGIPFDTMAHKLLGRSRYGHPKTEVLLNFSVQALDRIGGLITSERARNRDSTLARMDQTLGGDWWQSVYLQRDSADRLHEVVRGYRERLTAATGGWGGWTVPVADKIGARPEYLLMHFTQHPDGHWAFHEALSAAASEWRGAAHAANPSSARALEAIGQFTLDGLEQAPEFEEDEEAWVLEIEANLADLLAQGEPFVVQSRLRDVFGKALGLAREKHLRQALAQHYRAGRLRDNPKGKLQRFLVVPVT